MGRDKSFDIAKGICIIMVVMGHTWPHYRNWIYLFHMPYFLMVSGYFFSFNPHKVSELKEYWIKKVKALYAPYILTNGLFIIFTDFLIKINIYTNNVAFLEHTNEWPYQQVLCSFLTIKSTVIKLLKTLLLLGETQLGSPLWFLAELFLAVLVHSTAVFVLRKRKYFNRRCYESVALVLTFVLAIVISQYNFDVRVIVKRFPAAYFCFLLGVMLQNNRDKLKYMGTLCLISFSLLYLIQDYQIVEISAGQIGNPLLFVMAALAGWFMLISLSKYLQGIHKLPYTVVAIFEYIGKHTLSILCLHFLSFKLITWLYISYKEMPHYMLASFPIVFDASPVWKGMYVTAVVLIPMLIAVLWNSLKKMITTSFNKKVL